MLTLVWRSWKSWKREKGLALLAAAALAIGIGSATAIFTVVDAVMLKPLPYSQPDRWVSLLAGNTLDPDHSFSGLTYADCISYQRQMNSFEIFGWFPINGDFNLTFPGPLQHIEGIDVSPSLLANIGAIPAAGRVFAASDGPNVAVVSYRLFHRLGPTIIGRSITLNGKPYTVLGAMPAWFRLPVVTVSSRDSQNDVWIPLKPPIDEEHARHYAFYQAYARLKPGVPVSYAKAEAIRIAVDVRKQNHPENPIAYTAALFGLEDTVVRDIRPILLLLFSSAGLLLLITCANVAGLLLSRSVGRARETAIRIALGGSRNQLAVQYFLESLWVSLAASIAGIFLSLLFVRILLSLAANYIPRSEEVTTNWSAGLFALALAFVVAALSALAPLWQAFRTAPNEVLSNGVRASAGVRSRRLSRSLVIGEIALAFTLLSAGALLLWQFHTLNQTSPGFNPTGLTTFQLTRSDSKGSNSQQTSAWTNKLVNALESIPGVTNAAVSNQVPLAGCCYSTYLFSENRNAAIKDHLVSLMGVSTGYFKALGIPLLAGRLLEARDTNDNLTPIVIDESTAARDWPHQNPIGVIGRFGSQNGDKAQVVGIVRTVKADGLGKTPMPQVYLLSQLFAPEQIYVIVRSTLPAAGLANAIRRTVSQIDSTQPIYAFQSMEEIRSNSLVFQRIEWIVVTFFALAALLMASLGVYGLISYSVRQRTTEMGTRLAIGATGSQLLSLITRDGLRLAFHGILIGALTTAAATQLVRHYFDVQHLSVIPYLFSIVSVLALAFVASLVPAWRASILSPMVAIRNDSESVWVSARRTLGQARERISPPKPPAPLDSTLLSEFIEASRRAESFAEVFNAFLQELRQKLHAESALLLEKLPDGEFRCVASDPGSSLSALAIPENGFLLNRLRFYAAPMSFAPADIETSLRWAITQKPQQTKELELLKTIGLRLAAPLRTKTDLIGLLLFGQREGGGDYSLPEKTLLAACAEQFALTMENSRLNKRVLEQEKVRRDIDLATEVQRRLLPEALPLTAGATFGAFTLAARSVGGDYYDFLQVGDHRIGIALADVAGKGIAAALIMAVVQASLRIIASEEKVSLPELASKMNRFLHGSTGFSSYATFFYARLDEQKHQLRYVNAGHNPPYLVRANSAAPIEELSKGGMIIGMFPSADYEEAVVDLQTGDVLLAFTDGVTEALNPSGEEYGEERLKELARNVAHLPTQEMTASISQDLRTWIADAPQHDDITFIIMKVSAPEA